MLQYFEFAMEMGFVSDTVTRLTANFMCDLTSDLVIYKFRKNYGHTTPNVITETRCR